MSPLTTDTPAAELVLDPAAQALLFTEARTANTFSDEPDDVVVNV